MAKKKNILDVNPDKLKEVADNAIKSNVDNNKEDSKRISSTGNSYSLADAKKRRKKSEPLNSKGRKVFTTTLKPEYRELLSNVAYNKGISIADVLEDIIREYFKIND